MVAILPRMKKATLFASLVFAVAVFAKSMAPVHEIPLKDIDGKTTNLGAFAGKTVLLVNVASKCGYTPQYEQLEAVHQKYKDRGFTVVALTPDADAVPLGQVLREAATERVALVLGSEGHGLTPRWLAAADVRARIPMAPGVDSLNIASAAAIACYLVASERR